MGLFDRQGRQAAPPVARAPEPGSVEAISEANRRLVQLLRREAPHLPGRAYLVARTLSRHLDDVVIDPSAHLVDVGTRIQLERLASTHVPDTIAAYRGARGLENADGMLVEQLTTMERVAAQAAARSIEAARDAFLVQGSFLRDKYGAPHG